MGAVVTAAVRIAQSANTNSPLGLGERVDLAQALEFLQSLVAATLEERGIGRPEGLS